MKKLSKYKNIKTEGFDSKGECKRYNELLLLQKAGIITNLQKQPKITLQKSFSYGGLMQRAIIYKPDFSYTDLRHNAHGKYLKIYEDYKSAFTAKNPVYRIKAKLFRKMLLGYPDIEFREIIK